MTGLVMSFFVFFFYLSMSEISPSATKVILAFSGGLDTSFLVPYLMEKGYSVYTATVNTGGFTPEEMTAIAQKSKDLGAYGHTAINAVPELYNDFVVKIIQANYLRGGVYPACVGPERIIAAKKIAELASMMGISVVAHGSTGAGNDQVRFDLALRAMMSSVEILAPIRDEGFTRAQEVEYLKTKGVVIPQKNLDYSINVGVLGTTIGGKETKTPLGLVPDEIYPHVATIVSAPEAGEEIEIGFKQGVAVSINGVAMDDLALIDAVKSVAQKHGVGRGAHLGTTILGIKGRVVFEAAALRVLIEAHKELEKSVLTSKQIFWKDHLGVVWGDSVHEGLYFDPVVADIEAMIASSQKTVTGVVTVRLHKGNIIVVGSKSEYSLMDSAFASYGEENSFWNGRDAQGFSKIYGLEGIIAHKKHQL